MSIVTFQFTDTVMDYCLGLLRMKESRQFGCKNFYTTGYLTTTNLLILASHPTQTVKKTYLEMEWLSRFPKWPSSMYFFYHRPERQWPRFQIFCSQLKVL